MSAVCTAASATLTDATTGGTWSSNTTSVATVASGTGVVYGVSSGATVISYRLSTGCIATKVATVSAAPATVTGTASVCAGATTSLGETTTGGTWTSSNTSLATVSTSGVVKGVASGTATVSYSLATGCRATRVVTVNALPSSISGTASVCTKSSITLSDAGSGKWSSASAAIATVASASGAVHGVAAGTTNITYTLSTGCLTTKTVTVTACGKAEKEAVCIGTTTQLSEPIAGGTWSSDNEQIAPVDGSNGSCKRCKGAGERCNNILIH